MPLQAARDAVAEIQALIKLGKRGFDKGKFIVAMPVSKKKYTRCAGANCNKKCLGTQATVTSRGLGRRGAAVQWAYLRPSRRARRTDS